MISGFVVVVRLVHLALLALIFGGMAWSLYSRETAWRGLPALCALALITGLGLLFGVTAGLTDGSLFPAWENLGAVLSKSSFGRIWSLHLASILATLIACRIDRPGPVRLLTVAVSALPWVTLSLTGHSIVHEGLVGAAHRLIDAVHGLAAAVWLGGLLPLAMLIRRSLREEPVSDLARLTALVQRFSRVGVAAVVLIALSGLGNATMLDVALTGTTTFPYSWIVLAKIGSFLLMLILAAYNRFVLTPRLATPERDLAAHMLACSVMLEMLLGTLTLGLVALLGSLVPPVAG